MGLRQSMPAADREGPPPPPPQPSYWQIIKMGYAELVGAIIRPPRAEYTTAHLGPPTFEFCGRAFQRRDFEVVNGRGQRLLCSHWEPVEYPPLAGEDEDDDKKEDDGREGEGQEQQQQQQQQRINPTEQRRGSLPCIVYMHGNSSARMEALPQLSLCLSLGITMVALDFAGSGHSEGDFVSLGYYEKDDLKAVIEYLRASGRVSRIALWGRSMGAVTALMHGERDPSLAAMVCTFLRWCLLLVVLHCLWCSLLVVLSAFFMVVCVHMSLSPPSKSCLLFLILLSPPRFFSADSCSFFSSSSSNLFLDPRLSLRRLRLVSR